MATDYRVETPKAVSDFLENEIDVTLGNYLDSLPIPPVRHSDYLEGQKGGVEYLVKAMMPEPAVPANKTIMPLGQDGTKYSAMRMLPRAQPALQMLEDSLVRAANTDSRYSRESREAYF